MIERITNPDKLHRLLNDLNDDFKYLDINYGHECDLLFNKESITNNFSNNILLLNDIFVWANKKNHKYDSTCIFTRDRNVKFGKEIFSQFLWVSKNKKVSFKLLKTAVDFARKNNFEYISMYSTAKNPNNKKFKKFCEKLGFLEDSVNFISKIWTIEYQKK